MYPGVNWATLFKLGALLSKDYGRSKQSLGYICLTPFASAALVLFAPLQDWRSFRGQMVVAGIVVLSGAIL